VINTKSLADVELKEEGDRGLVTAVFATLGVVDLDGDVTRKGAFTSGANVVISAYGHTSWDGELPLGKGTITERGKEAILDGQFFLNTTHGRDAWETVKELSADGLQEWSYSLHNIQYEFGEQDGREVRFLNKIDVKEVSPVLKGAGIDTRTLAVKAGDTKFSDHRDVVLTALDDLTKRAVEVVTLRAAEGKPCPSVAELLAELEQRTKAFADLVAAAATPTTPLADLVANEFARATALLQGVTLS
jgi:hypothetical protein